MFTLLIQFFVAFFIATFKRFLPFLGKLLPWVSDNFRVLSYVTFSVGLFVTLIRSSNEVIDLVSGKAPLPAPGTYALLPASGTYALC